MSKRISTDEKIRDIINGPGDNDNYEQVLAAEKRAKNNLRRTSLYGGGARAHIPKIKKKKNFENSDTISPFTTAAVTKELAHQETSAVLPGAHSDQYRIVQFPTEKCHSDPDRVWYTTSSLTEGLRFVNQPAWYYGTNNKTKPADTSAMMAAGRYGFRGSKDIQQYHTAPYLVPSRTITSHTPSFLKKQDNHPYVNEYVPPISATKFQTINGLESPKLWPQTTEFVTGYPKKKSSAIPSYNRQTTTAEVVSRPGKSAASDRKRDLVIPQPSEHLNKIIDRIEDEEAVLGSFAKMERTGRVKSLTQMEIDKMNQTWSDRLSTTANSTLRSTMNRTIPPYEQHTLMDTTDSMRYSGTTALIVHSQSTDEIKFRYNFNATAATQPYQMRWKILTQLYLSIHSKLKREMMFSQYIHDMAAKLRAAAVMSGTPTMIKRSDFVKTMNKVKHFEDAPVKELSLLFSIFDILKKHTIRYVELLVGLYVFDNPKDAAIEKLASLYKIYEAYGSEIAPLDMCFNILCVCCATDDDRHDITTYFKSQFVQQAYRCSVLASEDDLNIDINDLSRTNIPRINVVSPSKQRQQQISRESSNHSSRLKSSKQFSDLFTPPAINTGFSSNEMNTTHDDISVHSHTSEKHEQLDLVDMIRPKTGLPLPTTGNNQIKHSDAAVQSTFNIVDSTMNIQMFVHVLCQCPELVNTFDRQLEERLIQCYGKDVRHTHESLDLGIDDENKDYSWIIALKKKTPKKKVEKASIYDKDIKPCTIESIFPSHYDH